jgi:ABC-type multidrug transport system fused ATPase/permease subunit
VSQEPLLFGGSILDNIRYGRPYATQAEVEAAARTANAHDFIAALPEGYNTQVCSHVLQGHQLILMWFYLLCLFA